MPARADPAAYLGALFAGEHSVGRLAELVGVAPSAVFRRLARV